MPKPGPRTTYKYSEEFKVTAVKSSQLPAQKWADLFETKKRGGSANKFVPFGHINWGEWPYFQADKSTSSTLRHVAMCDFIGIHQPFTRFFRKLNNKL